MISKKIVNAIMLFFVLLIIGLLIYNYYYSYQDYNLRKGDIQTKVSEIAIDAEVVSSRVVGSQFVVLYRQNNEYFALHFEKALLSERFALDDPRPYKINEGESVRMGSKNLFEYYVYDVSQDSINVIQQRINVGIIIAIIVLAALIILALFGAYELIRYTRKKD